jgi:hypothetical protein
MHQVYVLAIDSPGNTRKPTESAANNRQPSRHRKAVDAATHGVPVFTRRDDYY